jgi:hypothetical protein
MAKEKAQQEREDQYQRDGLEEESESSGASCDENEIADEEEHSSNKATLEKSSALTVRNSFQPSSVDASHKDRS